MKKKVTILCSLLIILLLCVSTSLLFLPYLVDAYLLPKLLVDLPFAEKKVSLSRISPWKLRGQIALGDNGQDYLTIPGIEISFSPGSILKGRIDTILIDGGTIYLPPGVIPTKRQNSKAVTPTEDYMASALLVPVACDKIIIKNSLIIMRQEKKQFSFLLNGYLKLNFSEQRDNKKLLTGAEAALTITGATDISATITIKQMDQGYDLLFKATAPDISQINQFVAQTGQLSIAGQLALSGRLTSKNMAAISLLQATAKFSNLTGSAGDIKFTNNPASKDLIIEFQGDNNSVNTSIKNLYFISPLASSLDMRSEYNLATGTFTGSGKAILQDLSLPLTFELTGNRDEKETQVNIKASSESFAINSSSPILIDQVSVEANARVKKDRATGSISGSVNKITLVDKTTVLNDISLFLPWQYPFAEKTNKRGNFKISSIEYDSTTSGSLSGTIDLSSSGAEFSTQFSSSFGPDIKVKCSGSLAMDKESRVNCDLPATAIDSVSFPPFLKLPEDISITGKLSARASYSFSGTGNGGNLHLQLNDGTVQISENTLSGIDIAIFFPDLPLVHSAPSQLATIQSVQFGTINLSEAKIRFHLENSESIFFEKGIFSWCGGKVESNSFRLSKGSRELQTTLYCDRLNFSQLLQQFGIEGAVGEGALNGRLPVLLSDSGIKFDDGFLFSTPGNSGIVNFNNSTQLRQAMGAIDQTPYLDYTMQALENFSYNWTKLTFNSYDQDLLIKMELDGKPASPLPFGYKSGNIVPDNKGAGLQHPIRLDVNFRLPMTDLFQYGKNMQSIMENM